MAAHVCPWWGGYFIDNPVRRLLHNPERILMPHVQPGMTVIDFGCGMGLFTLAAAELVGGNGRVIAVDLQPQMLDVLWRRARKRGVADRIHLHRAEPNSMGLAERADFAVAFYSVHEVPDSERLLQEVRQCLRPTGRFLVAEPIGHVTSSDFQKMLSRAEQAGFHICECPRIRWSRAVLLERAHVVESL